MPGRHLLSEDQLAVGPYGSKVMVRRRAILRETLAAFERDGPRYAELAQDNLRRWRSDARPRASPPLRLLGVDWGEATQALTREFGVTFAVLNMANAYVPGGAYVEGTAAQEENMFRRTDCHFHVLDEHMIDGRYTRAMTDLISGVRGRVYLDVEHPRVCVRGPEDRSRDDLGYRWLGEDAIFPFYELRAAAEDLRDGLDFDPEEAGRRIRAQLHTLIDAGVRHAVLSASGCGAFANPPEEVARIYRSELEPRLERFECVAFAIFYPGYGPDNFAVFDEVFADRATR